MTEIKAVIFDVGGVLHLPIGSKIKNNEPKGVHELMAKKLGISVDEWFDCIDTIYTKSVEGKLTRNQVVSQISKHLHIDPKKLVRLLIMAYKKKYKKNIELHKFALGLKKRGYKIAILSDQWHISKEALIEPSFTKGFNTIVISTDVKMRKPNPRIYKLILRKLKTPAKNCVFIDNVDWNLKPAKKLGIHTILFKNNKQLFKQLEKLGIK